MQSLQRSRCGLASTGSDEKNKDPHVAQPCEPTPYILLGDLDDLTVATMKEHKVGVVISMCPEEMQEHKGIIAELIAANVNCFTVRASENDSYDILPMLELYGPILSQSVDAGRKTFIHCWGGINRAPALVLGFMVLHKDYPIIDAFKRIVKARGEVLTNKYFRREIVTAALGKQEKIQV